ncbi:unnamed protein product [Caenorhabditis sp. 36 PRJEB53466]|nr:unnamed protein product [Caenorhabditis sp. 36 PRJEB53466]
MAENSNVEQFEQIFIMIDDVIQGFQVNEKIDEGNFGQVFKVSKEGKKYAMKVEPNRLDGGPSALKNEIEIVVDVTKHDLKFCPKFISGGKELKYHVLVMDLLGDNLKKLRQRCRDPNACSPGTWSRVGIQCLYVIKAVHDCGYVHRDLKPANFAMGPIDDGLTVRVLFLLDFGISRKFVLQKKGTAVGNGEFDWRVARRKTRAFKGTPVYASPNAHSFQDLGRIDDVWSLLYMLAELVQPLPWSSLEDQTLERSKLGSKLRDLFKNDAFEAIEASLRASNYYSFPNYHLVYRTFWRVYAKSGVSWLDPFDWETKQMPAYQRWRANAENRTTLFPWEYADIAAFFRHDPWKALQSPIVSEKNKKKKEREQKKKKQQLDGETLTAEAITADESLHPITKRRSKPKNPVAVSPNSLTKKSSKK